ncbi:glycoside hydrolase family 30 protein [uncultured Algibacter sp.]|uniref:glycoside hydrolase family 30 protein n=1 Tax=uncultured Algibacter sp. TaxID=298659 RepID=UPI00262CF6AA|nr:glycoside hydrolase family 30 protein [uncultured Algibacter sp.]
MKKRTYIVVIMIMFLVSSCDKKKENKDNMVSFEVFETSRKGNKLSKVTSFQKTDSVVSITLKPQLTLQTITGFGGAFTEASAYLLNQLSKANKDTILKAYFAKDGARYSLTRTHMNSCDFSISNYSYTPVEGDKTLEHFSIEEDMDDLIPMIKGAMAVSEDGFKIFGSPWTAAPWMKDNNSWVGGKLLPEYYDTWALFFSKYADAYKNQGIDIWGFTVENEPMGNGNNWESMHYTPDEMTNFVQNYLGPKLKADGKGDLKILGFDQNRAHLKDWVDSMYKTEETSEFFDGTAIHWYDSTFEIFPEELQDAHNKAPNKLLIQTEACVDSEIPKWQDDDWYWRKEATDWGYDWASDERKHFHPKYAPVNRYARDIIGCLNNWVDGWVDWNMVLDTNGGPNWFENWCVAPVIVDPDKDEVYFTPLYYTMAHFSKYIRPDAKVIELENSDMELKVTAAKNTDGTIAVVIFNETETPKGIYLAINKKTMEFTIDAQAIQTIMISN